MYVKVIRKNVVRIPPSRVFRNQKYTIWESVKIYWDKSDPIPRENKWKYDFIFCESSRENGKVKTKQKHIATVSYWDIVDGNSLDAFYYGISKHFKETESYDLVWQLVEKKLMPIEQEILAEYEKTEEYTVRTYWRKEEKRVAAEIREQWERQEEEKRKREKEQWQDFDYESFFKRYSASSSTGSVIKNKDLAKELFKAGYRQLSKKYHPDVAAADGQMCKELNNLKEQLDQLVK